ncbi:MAG: ribosome biogenesis GTP-binding protein YihA/YsxC [Myxococcota bacterium]
MAHDSPGPLRNTPVELVGSYPATLPTLGLPEVAFAGRSNVGKSSALNCLWNRRGLARVSRTPGRTQLINLFRAGNRAVFADLPGYGYAHVPDAVRAEWKPMIERYLAERAALVLVVVLIDIRRDPQEMDGALMYGLTEARIPSVVVATKIDKLGKQQRSRQLAALRRAFHLPAGQPIGLSSVTTEGRDAVWDAIERAVAAAAPAPEPDATGAEISPETPGRA